MWVGNCKRSLEHKAAIRFLTRHTRWLKSKRTGFSLERFNSMNFDQIFLNRLIFSLVSGHWKVNVFELCTFLDISSRKIAIENQFVRSASKHDNNKKKPRPIYTIGL